MMMTTLLIFSLHLAHADQTAEVDKSAPAASAAAAAPNEEAEAGGPLVEEASLRGVKKRSMGYSWRNTQVILMGAGILKCRLGGVDARRAAVPALKSAGFCDVTSDKNAMKPEKMPQGTVWVYHHPPHGNTVVKMKGGKLFDNSAHAFLPKARGAQVTVMKPNCGPKTRTCGEYKVEKAEDSKAADNDNSELVDNALHPTQQRLEAEQSCGYANAFRATDAFNECVEEKLSK
jgi:hypothetical protein